MLILFQIYTIKNHVATSQTNIENKTKTNRRRHVKLIKILQIVQKFFNKMIINECVNEFMTFFVDRNIRRQKHIEFRETK